MHSNPQHLNARDRDQEGEGGEGRGGYLRKRIGERMSRADGGSITLSEEE
jgi:hypothetical protein